MDAYSEVCEVYEIIPKSLQKECLVVLHSWVLLGTSHIGTTGMKQFARRWIWWPEMNSDISKIAAHCENCQRNASKPRTVFDVAKFRDCLAKNSH